MSHTTDTAIAFVIAQNTQGEDNVIWIWKTKYRRCYFG
jgi:hypothetical protein